jgi:uncharacterized protein YjiS (DUF1127 family)
MAQYIKRCDLRYYKHSFHLSMEFRHHRQSSRSNGPDWGAALVLSLTALEDVMPSKATRSNFTRNPHGWKDAPDLFGWTILSLAEAVWAGIKSLAKFFEHRRDAAILARLDDRMLADIGLTRSDLRDALSQPPWRDPTAILVIRAGVRRARRRRAGCGLAHDLVTAPSIVADVGSERDVTRAAMRGAR